MNKKIEIIPVRFQIIFFLFIQISLFSICPNIVSADAESEEYKLAAGLYNQKRYDLAAESFQGYIKKFPEGSQVADARYYYGLSLYRNDDYEKSHSAFQEVISEHPQYKNMADVQYRLAGSSYFQEKYDHAEKEFSEFLKKYPKNSLASFAYPYLGDIQLSQKKYKQAIESFQNSVELFPDGSMIEDSKFGLAKAYTSLKQFDKAIPIYRELEKLENGERQVDSLFHLATIYFDEKNYQEAAKSYSDLDARFEHHDLAPLSRMNAGYSYFKLGEFEKAITYFQKAAETEEQLDRGEYWVGLSYKALKQYEKAAEVFNKMAERELPEAFAVRINYYRADSEHRSNMFEKSLKHFLEFVEKWPKNQSADDSLYFAAEAALQQDQIAMAKRLIVKMEKEYPDSSLFMHRRMLKGRIYSASARIEISKQKKPESDYKVALNEYGYVYTNSKIPRTRNLARYYSGQTLREMKKPKESSAVLKPVVEEIMSKEDGSEFIDALIVQARNYLDLKQYQQVMDITSKFLEESPESDKRDSILSSRAISAVTLGQMEEANKAMDQLTESFPDNPKLTQTRYTVAEVAYEKENWKDSEKYFSEVIEAGKNNKLYATSLSGLAWSTYQQDDFEKSKSFFKQISEEFPEDVDLGPEASFMYAQSLQNNKELDKAAKAYLNAFNQYSVTHNNKEDKEESSAIDYSKNPYVYRAGLQAARVLRLQKKVDEADQAYDNLMKKYPDVENKDLLYDEWALLNYEEERFDRADEIFRLLIRYCPKSELIDNAKLSLAQSDYLNGKLKDARKTFQVLYDDDQSDKRVREVALHNLIIINTAQSQWKLVSSQCKQFLKQYPESAELSEVKFYQAESLLHLHYNEDSFKILDELHQQAESIENPAGWQKKIPLLLAELYFQKTDYTKSEKLVAGLREQYPELTTLYQGDEILGRCYKQQAKFDLARKFFKKAIDDPKGKGSETAAKSQFMIAECYMIQKNYQDALREYLKVYHLHEYPRWQAAGLLQAAKCDEALDHWENAVKSYEEMISEFPKSELVQEANKRLQVARTHKIR